MDRDEFVAKFKSKLDEWNADIDQLEDRAKKAGAKVRAESGEALSELRDKRDSINTRLHELGQSLGEAWHDVREGLDEAGEDLRAAIVDARKRFSDDETE